MAPYSFAKISFIYLRGMENNHVSVKMIFNEFRTKTCGELRQEEIMQLVYILFEEWMGWTKADVHLETRSY